MNSSRRRRLLCVVYEPGNFQAWMKLVEWGRDCGEFDCILWSPYCLPESDRYQAEASARGSVYVEETSVSGGLADVASRLSGWLSADSPRLPLDLLARMNGVEARLEPDIPAHALALTSALPEAERLRVWAEVDAIRRRINFCDDWLARLNVDAVILPEDNVERDSYAWVESARRRRIRSVVLSYGALSAQEAVNAYKFSPTHAVNPLQSEWVRQHLPRWLSEGEGYAITRLPYYQLLARELTMTAPFNPWLVNAGHADAIALESAAIKATYIEFGFLPNQLRVIGHPFQDILADLLRGRDRHREALFARCGLDRDRPLVVVAMPPDQFPCRQGVYPSYADLVSAFACLPAQLAHCNVVISPHPNLSERASALIRGTGVTMIAAPVVELLPLADIYVACVSSTIKWALACGIPVINYDCYGYQYSEYRDLPQVLCVDDEDGFREALKLVGNHELREPLIQSARKQATHWGALDGGAFRRLIDLCFSEVGTSDSVGPG